MCYLGTHKGLFRSWCKIIAVPRGKIVFLNISPACPGSSYSFSFYSSLWSLSLLACSELHSLMLEGEFSVRCPSSRSIPLETGCSLNIKMCRNTSKMHFLMFPFNLRISNSEVFLLVPSFAMTYNGIKRQEFQFLLMLLF